MNQRTHEATLNGVHAYYMSEREKLRNQIAILKEATDTADINLKVYIDTIGYAVTMFDGNDERTESFARDMGCDLSNPQRRLELVEGLRAALLAETSRFLKDFDRKER